MRAELWSKMPPVGEAEKVSKVKASLAHSLEFEGRSRDVGGR